MELTKLTAMTLDNKDVRIIGFLEDEIVLMYDISQEYTNDILAYIKKYKGYRCEFMFSRSMDVKLFNPNDDKEYPITVPGSVEMIKPTANYFKDSFMYFILDTSKVDIVIEN